MPNYNEYLEYLKLQSKATDEAIDSKMSQTKNTLLKEIDAQKQRKSELLKEIEAQKRQEDIATDNEISKMKNSLLKEIDAQKQKSNEFKKEIEDKEESNFLNDSLNLAKQMSAAPSYGKAYRSSGVAKFKKGNYDAALADFKEAVEWDGENLNYHWRGRTYLEKGNYDAALADFKKAIELKGDNYDYYWRGMAYFKKGNYDAALADFKKAIELKEKPLAGDYFWRGRAYFEKGTAVHENNIKAAAEAAEAAKDNNTGFRGFGSSPKVEYDNVVKSCFNAALSDFNKAVELRGNVSDYHWRGESYLKKGDCDAALSDFNKAVELRGNADDYCWCGAAYRIKRDNKAARKNYEKALEIDPECEKGKTGLSILDLLEAFKK